jgi:hypothetical protein
VADQPRSKSCRRPLTEDDRAGALAAALFACASVPYWAKLGEKLRACPGRSNFRLNLRAAEATSLARCVMRVKRREKQFSMNFVQARFPSLGPLLPSAVPGQHPELPLTTFEEGRSGSAIRPLLSIAT